MFKILFIIALLLIGLYFSAQGLWMMHISAFGFEISLSYPSCYWLDYCSSWDIFGMYPKNHGIGCKTIAPVRR